jgi:uncharacterized protein GlcG (DUF336 family)
VSSDDVWVMRPTVPCAASRQLVDAAVAEATAIWVPVTVVIVDESGVLKEMCRMDGAPLVSVQTAMSKAHAAAAIGIPPDEFYTAIQADAAAVASFAARPGMALIAGGLCPGVQRDPWPAAACRHRLGHRGTPADSPHPRARHGARGGGTSDCHARPAVDRAPGALVSDARLI